MQGRNNYRLTKEEKVDLAKQCEELLRDYPENHPERIKIEEQVKGLLGDQKSSASN